MQDNGIKKSPYKGIIISCFVLLAVPVALYFLLKYVIVGCQPKYDYEINKYTAMALGFGSGFLFQFTCIISGMFKGTFSVVLKRIIGFFGNLTVSFKFACKMYHDDFVEDGAVFWILLVVIGSTLFTSIYGFVKFLELYPL